MCTLCGCSVEFFSSHTICGGMLNALSLCHSLYSSFEMSESTIKDIMFVILTGAKKVFNLYSSLFQKTFNSYSFAFTYAIIFPQVGNRSSEFRPEVRRVRREGSYIYEEFMPTGGTDVKVV